MTKAAWLLVLTLFVVSASGIVPASIGMFFPPFAILLAMCHLAVAERKRLADHLKQGEKNYNAKNKKIFLAIFVVLALILVFIGRLTKQRAYAQQRQNMSNLSFHGTCAKSRARQ